MESNHELCNKEVFLMCSDGTRIILSNLRALCDYDDEDNDE